MLLRLHKTYGNSWSSISKLLMGRTPQQCRGRFFQVKGGGKVHAGRSKGGRIMCQPACELASCAWAAQHDPQQAVAGRAGGQLPLHATRVD